MKPLTLTILLLGLFHSSAGERLRGRKLAAGGVAEGVALAAVYEICDFSSRINSIPFIGSSEVARSSEDCKAAVQRACSQAGEVASCNTAIACLMGRTETKDPCAALAANGAKTAYDLYQLAKSPIDPEGWYGMVDATQCIMDTAQACAEADYSGYKCDDKPASHWNGHVRAFAYEHGFSDCAGAVGALASLGLGCGDDLGVGLGDGRFAGMNAGQMCCGSCKAAAEAGAAALVPVHGDTMGCLCADFPPDLPAPGGGRRRLSQTEVFVRSYCDLPYGKITDGHRWVKNRSGCGPGCEKGTANGHDACIEVLTPAPTPMPTPAPAIPLTPLPVKGGASYTAELELSAGHHTLTMRDSYGDGWNGATFTIEGVQLGGAGPRVTSGWPQTAESDADFSVEERGTFRVTVTEGGWPQEISWEITATPYIAWGCATGTCDNAGPFIMPNPEGPSPQEEVNANGDSTNANDGAPIGVCTFPVPGDVSLPAWATAPYADVASSCAAWFHAGDWVFDIQAGGATPEFCGCCAACDPFAHGHQYGTCNAC